MTTPSPEICIEIRDRDTALVMEHIHIAHDSFMVDAQLFVDWLISAKPHVYDSWGPIYITPAPCCN